MKAKLTAERRAAIEGRQIKMAGVVGCVLVGAIIYGFVAHQPGFSQFGVGCAAGLVLCFAPIVVRRFNAARSMKRTTG